MLVLLGATHFGCHSFRHIVGGGTRSVQPYGAARTPSLIVPHLEEGQLAQRAAHALFAWTSVFSGSRSPTSTFAWSRWAYLDRPQHLGLSSMVSLSEIQTREHDVVVIGAGGAGLRAAIECSRTVDSTPASCASRCSARLTPSWPRAAWRRRSATSTAATTGRSTSATRCAAASSSTTGAWRELHAQQAPDRVRELEEWGAVFDRTKDGSDQPAQLRRPPLPAVSPTSATGRASR